MTSTERDELGQMRQCVHNLTLQVARLSQAIEPLVRIQEEQNRLRDRVAELEGFKAAVIWLVGLIGGASVLRLLLQIWFGGKVP